MTYRERMDTSGNLLNLYGLLPMSFILGTTLGILIALPLPFGTTLLLRARDYVNSYFQPILRKRLFNGFKPTGWTTTTGYGSSQSGKTDVKVYMKWRYDGGLGFTMLSACTVAAEIVAQRGAASPASEGGAGGRPSGFVSPVSAIGGLELARAFRDGGATINVTHRSKL